MNKVAMCAEDLSCNGGKVRAVKGLDLNMPRGIVFGLLAPRTEGNATGPDRRGLGRKLWKGWRELFALRVDDRRQRYPVCRRRAGLPVEPSAAA
jgi:hypothetical protein